MISQCYKQGCGIPPTPTPALTKRKLKTEFYESLNRLKSLTKLLSSVYKILDAALLAAALPSTQVSAKKTVFCAENN